jgi:hypothetical protein
LAPALEWSLVASRCRGLHAFVGEVHGVPRRANVALPVHLARAGLEEGRAATEHHRGEVQAQLVDEAMFERLADDLLAGLPADPPRNSSRPVGDDQLAESRRQGVGSKRQEFLNRDPRNVRDHAVGGDASVRPKPALCP